MNRPNIIIIGAGMAGLLAANLLRRHWPVVFERQQTLPANHSALLRFRSPAVSDATGIPFRRVLVRKGIWDSERKIIRNECTIADANAYSLKVSGQVLARSIWNLQPEERWISPPDFVNRMAEMADVRLNEPFSFIDKARSDIAISTIPMPFMMQKFKDWHDGPLPEFRNRAIGTIKVNVKQPSCDVYQTVYFPDSSHSFYRATLHGDELTVEGNFNFTSDTQDGDFSMPWAIVEFLLRQVFKIDVDVNESGPISLVNLQYKHQLFGKITPIDEDLRRRFIVWLTDQHGIFSLGRFATWRPGLLLDDILQDIKCIETMIFADSYWRKAYIASQNA